MNADFVDELLSGPVVVLGSLPPQGRDLDLLVPHAEIGAVGAALTGGGFVRRGHEHVRFAGGTAYAVELIALEDRLPTAAAVQAVRSEATALPGYRNLLAPAPAHQLLLLAQRLRFSMVVDRRRAERLAGFGPADWEAARGEAAAWGLGAELDDLRRAAEHPVPGSPRRRRSPVVALSGLDGAGKSTHAEHLARALTALGEDVVVEWNKVGRDRTLERVAAPVKALLARRAGSGTGADLPTTIASTPEPPHEEPDGQADGEARNHPDGPRPPPGPGTRLRQRSALLTWCWTCVVALANARTHRRTVAGNAGSVVICDRYVLDTAAHLRHRYGAQRRFRAQRALNRWFSPRPAVAVFLDVPPAEARRRKPEQYTTRDLEQLRELYLEETAAAGVTVVDAAREELVVAADVAERVWRRLGEPSRLGTWRSAVRRRLRR